MPTTELAARMLLDSLLAQHKRAEALEMVSRFAADPDFLATKPALVGAIAKLRTRR